MTDKVEALRGCGVLQGFTEVGLQILAAVVRERLYRTAQALQVQGDPPKDAGVLFLASGRVRCEVRDHDGRILGLGTLQPGDHLGGLRLFSPPVSSPLSATAESEVVGLLLDKAAFARLQAQKPNTAVKLLNALAADFGQRLGENQAQFADFAVYAGIRANMNQSSFALSDYAPDHTPTLRNR